MKNYRGLFIGLATIDIQYFVKQFPEPNTKIKSEAPSIMVGGPSTNAAIAFSALNGNAYLATAIGNNSFATFVASDFQHNNILYTDLVSSQPVNPVLASVVTSVDGDRTIFTHNPSEINPEISVTELFEKTQPQLLLLDGFYPEFSIDSARMANAKGIPVVLDCGSWKQQYSEILKYTDIAICSDDFYPPQCSSSKEVHAFLGNYGIQFVAISRGDKSILFHENDNQGEIEIIKTNVTDTLGAGDFLHGAFCYYWLKYHDFKTALLLASKIASFSCRFKGTRLWIDSINTVY